jgi:hypothetical protein
MVREMEDLILTETFPVHNLRSGDRQNVPLLIRK